MSDLTPDTLVADTLVAMYESAPDPPSLHGLREVDWSALRHAHGHVVHRDAHADTVGHQDQHVVGGAAVRRLRLAPIAPAPTRAGYLGPTIIGPPATLALSCAKRCQRSMPSSTV